MGDQQQSDEFNIYGILADNQANSKISMDDFKQIVSDYLQLGPIHQAVIKALQVEHNVQMTSRQLIDLQFPNILKRSSTGRINYSLFQQFLNNRITSQNVKIIKAAIHLYSIELISFADIREAAIIFQLKELELMSQGLPCDTKIINSMLWKINKTISLKVLEEWIKRCQEFMEIKGQIQTFEFLFLIANCVNRINFFNRIPKVNLDTTRDPKFNLFHVDNSGLGTLKNPDQKIQNYMNYQYNMNYAQFKGRCMTDKNEYYSQKRTQKFDSFLKNKNSDRNDFQKMLHDPELYIEIKEKLKDAQQVLNHSKLNGKLLRGKPPPPNTTNIIIAQLKQDINFTAINEQLHCTQIQNRASEKKEQDSQTLMRLKSQESSKKSVIDTVRNQKTFIQKNSQRPQTAKLSEIKQQVHVHRVMSRDKVFMTEFQGQLNHTTSASQLPMRPISGIPKHPSHHRNMTHLSFQNNKLILPLQEEQTTYTHQNILSVLDEELNNFESVVNIKQQKQVFYGSASTTKRSFTINLPWSASTKASK